MRRRSRCPSPSPSRWSRRLAVRVLACPASLEVVRELPAPTRVACDVRATLVDAARVFAAQKGASSDADVAAHEARLLAMTELAPYASLPGAGAAGGLGAALASLGAELVAG